MIFRIAARYLLAKKSHAAVNVISMISMAGIAVAALAMICVLSVFNGFSELASSRLSVVDPEVKITTVSGRVIVDADSLAAVVRRLPCVAAAMPVVEERALAVYGDRQVPVMMRGLPAGYDSVAAWRDLVIDGEMREPDALGAYTTLSVGVAVRLGARPGYGDYFIVNVPRRLGRINPALPVGAFRSDSLIVSGVYQSEQAEVDTDIALMPLENVRRLLDYNTEATSVDIALRPGTEPSRAVADISAAVGPLYRVADRMAQEETSFRMIEIEKWITFLMLLFILVMASFNILSTMSMLIIEKQESITILRSLGATTRMVRRIFLTEGFLISAVGGTVGLLLGIILCLLQQATGFISLGGDPSQMSIDHYPVVLQFPDILVVLAVITVIGFLSGLISSRFVPKVNA